MFSKQFDPNALKNKPQAGDKGAGTPSGGGGGGINLVQLIVILLTMSIINLGAIGAAIYFLGPVMLNPLVDKLISSAQPAEGEGKEGEHKEGEHKEGEAKGGEHKEGAGHGEKGEASTEALASLGQNYKLEDFTVNLTPNPRSPSENQFLRAKMSLSFKVPEEENCLIQKMKHAHDKPAEGGGEGGHGGGAPKPEGEDPCEKAFKEKLQTFLPNIRDVINSSLMRRTANALSSIEGQEMLKDEIIEQLNTLVHPIEYSVLRINFEEFIVQR